MARPVPRRAARLAAVVTAATLAAAACGGEPPPAPIEGCAELGFSAFRCDLVVRAAAARLPAIGPEVRRVVVTARNDRQDALSGTRFVLANVEFRFADRTSTRIEVACRVDDPRRALCAGS